MHKVPQVICLQLLQYLHKTIRHEIDFLSADKHKSFLQNDSITLDVRSRACLKHPKQQAYNTFAIF